MNDAVEELTRTWCCTCGVHFSIPKKLLDSRRETGRPFYCPNGHDLRFGNSLQSRLDKAVRERDEWEKEAQRLIEVCDNLRAENNRLNGTGVASPVLLEGPPEKKRRSFLSYFQ